MSAEVCVIGLGLIGGSLLRAATGAGRRGWGATDAEADIDAARAAGVDVLPTVDALHRAAERDALVVVAVPLPAVESVLAQIAEHAPRCRLTDVVGVKAPVAAAVRRALPSAGYVGGHPMAGSSSSGFAAGSATLFDGAAWVLSTDDGPDDGTIGTLWSDVARLALDCGAHVVPATASAHDDAVARISHLPHLLAAVLASVGGAGGPLALSLGAGSFTDGTRVAGTRPELVRAMCEGNRDALLTAVDDTLGKLGAARGSLASTGGLESTIRTGHLARRAFDAARATGEANLQVELTSAGSLARLTEIGLIGGRVTAVHGTRAQVRL